MVRNFSNSDWDGFGPFLAMFRFRTYYLKQNPPSEASTYKTGVKSRVLASFTAVCCKFYNIPLKMVVPTYLVLGVRRVVRMYNSTPWNQAKDRPTNAAHLGDVRLELDNSHIVSDKKLSRKARATHAASDKCVEVGSATI